MLTNKSFALCWPRHLQGKHLCVSALPLSLCSLVTFQTRHLQIAACIVEHSLQYFLLIQDQSAKREVSQFYIKLGISIVITAFHHGQIYNMDTPLWRSVNLVPESPKLI